MSDLVRSCVLNSDPVRSGVTVKTLRFFVWAVCSGGRLHLKAARKQNFTILLRGLQ